MNQPPAFNTAHEQAKVLMDEPFFYSSIDETAPFGNDDGADTFEGFCEWRQSNPSGDPLDYLNDQLEDWGYPPFDTDEEDPFAIVAYAKQTELGIGLLTGMDAAIIAVAFAQLYAEGAVEEPVIRLAINAIRRQLHPDLLNLWDTEYVPTREEQLRKMMGVLHRV